MAENKYTHILQNIQSQLSTINKKLCEISDQSVDNSTYDVSARYCDGSNIEERVTGIVQTIPHGEYVQKVQICTTTNKDYEVVCISNDNGITIVKGVQVFDTAIYPPTFELWLNGVDVTATYTVVPCQSKNRYDYEITKICVDGYTWDKVYVWDKQGDNIPNLVTILWIDNNGNIVSAPDITLIDNINCNEICNPIISDAFADDLSTLSEGNSISITKPSCCELLVTTSIGSFRVIKGIQSYSTDTFNCPIIVNNITILSGNCTLSDVHIISNKIK